MIRSILVNLPGFARQMPCHTVLSMVHRGWALPRISCTRQIYLNLRPHRQKQQRISAFHSPDDKVHCHNEGWDPISYQYVGTEYYTRPTNRFLYLHTGDSIGSSHNPSYHVLASFVRDTTPCPCLQASLKIRLLLLSPPVVHRGGGSWSLSQIQFRISF